jgi:sensor histidine kinase regulating citrate/malate metabolism
MKHSTVSAIVFFMVSILLTGFIACTPSSPKAMVNPPETGGLKSVKAAVIKDIPEAINAVNLAYSKKIIDGALNQSLLDYMDSADHVIMKLAEEDSLMNLNAVKKENNLKSLPADNKALETAVKLHRDIVFIKEMFTAEKLK